MLLPEAVRDVAEVDYASHIRDAVVKPLLMFGTRNVAWNLTGSCMVMVWMQIAKMPPNGYALILGNRTIQLPVRAVHLWTGWCDVKALGGLRG